MEGKAVKVVPLWKGKQLEVKTRLVREQSMRHAVVLDDTMMVMSFSLVLRNVATFGRLDKNLDRHYLVGGRSEACFNSFRWASTLKELPIYRRFLRGAQMPAPQTRGAG